MVWDTNLYIYKYNPLSHYVFTDPKMQHSSYLYQALQKLSAKFFSRMAKAKVFLLRRVVVTSALAGLLALSNPTATRKREEHTVETWHRKSIEIKEKLRWAQFWLIAFELVHELNGASKNHSLLVFRPVHIQTIQSHLASKTNVAKLWRTNTERR